MPHIQIQISEKQNLSSFFLELEGRQVQPLNPGSRMGQSAGRTKLFSRKFLLVCQNQQDRVLLLLFLFVTFINLLCACLRKCPTAV